MGTSYKDTLSVMEAAKDDFQTIVLYSLCIFRLSKLDRHRFNSKYLKRINEILDAEGRLTLRASSSSSQDQHMQDALDNAWRHLRAGKLFGFFLCYLIAQVTIIGSKSQDRFRSTIAYKECREKYNEIVTNMGLPDRTEPEVLS
jgi:hypothetical protein